MLFRSVERTGDSPLLHVSTIHDFLWSVVKPHQSALKRALVSHNMALDAESRRKRDPAALDIALRVVKVNYSDRGAEFLEGRLFHDDLIDVARLLFKGNPLMAKIAAAQFPYIFVDEYQDTSEAVVEILIDRILATSEGKVVIGFFGDKLQSIYHGGEHPGIGEIPAAQREKLAVVVKEENYRCSKAVIAVLNHIRRDIQQFPAGKNAEGLAVYMRVPPPKSGDDLIGNARTVLIEKFGLSLEGAQQRELFLTHRLIARKAGYERLLKAYADRGGFSRDQLLRGDDPIISFFRDQVEPLIAAWEAGKVGKVISVLRAGGFVLANVKEKAAARAAIEKLVALTRNQTIGEVLRHIVDTNLLELQDELSNELQLRAPNKTLPVPANDEETAHQLFYSALFATPFTEAVAFNHFLDEHSPFATKHGVKGDEFETVFVVLDDKGASWNLYSFGKYLSGEDEQAGNQRASRTRNLLYVCCSRAKVNLIVVDLAPASLKKDARVKEIFDEKFCVL